MVNWQWSKQAKESNHFMYTNAYNQLRCFVFIERGTALICKTSHKTITCENFKRRAII